MTTTDQTQLRQIIEQVLKEVLAEQSSAASTPSGATLPSAAKGAGLELAETGTVERGTDPKEVVIGFSPAFATHIHETIIGIPLGDVVRELCAGIEEEGLHYRFCKVYKTADVGFIAHEAAKLSGSGVGVGIQSRGTSVIHQRDLDPLNNLELFPQAPLIDLTTFRAMGKNAALYAKGESPSPVPTANDQMARPKYQAKAALLHNKETRLTDTHKKTQAVQVKYV